jgi:hypothetical protein
MPGMDDRMARDLSNLALSSLILFVNLDGLFSKLNEKKIEQNYSKRIETID